MRARRENHACRLGKAVPLVALTNLTGHPAVVVPCGFTKKRVPTAISFIGRLYAEGDLLALAKAYQDATDHHTKHPPLK